MRSRTFARVLRFASLAVCISAVFSSAVPAAEKAPEKTDKRPAGKKDAVLFILDVSSSMTGEPLARTKETLSRAAGQAPPEVGLGLISFSGCTERDVKLEYPVEAGKVQHQSLIKAANAMTTHVGTDIYHAMLMAETEANRIGPDWCLNLMLLTDGFDTCLQGDYKEVASRIMLINPGCNKIHVIAVGTMDWENETLSKVAEVGKGQFEAVADAGQLDQVVTKVMEIAAPKAKAKVKWEVGKTNEQSEEAPADGTKAPETEAEAPAPAKEREKAAEARAKEREQNRAGAGAGSAGSGANSDNGQKK